MGLGVTGIMRGTFAAELHFGSGQYCVPQFLGIFRRGDLTMGLHK